jgi:hypothetical protein
MFWPFKRRAAPDTPVPQGPSLWGMRSNPIVVNPDAEQRVQIAAYRLDQICRYVQSRADEGRSVQGTRLLELQTEAAVLIAQLRQAGYDVQGG